ncbi:MAG: NlpC/P60 family protein [Negativicutes bacterium]|nr:NlpC/P60 family protein [Negativicutes bacterium]
MDYRMSVWGMGQKMRKLIIAVICLWLWSATAKGQVPYFMAGDSGAAIREIQTQLQKGGFYKGKTNGRYDDATVAAVKAFQRKNKLSPSGVVSMATYRALFGRDFPGFSPTSQADRVVLTAMRYMGTRYVFGGSTPKGFDCSGFVQYVYSQNGIKLPRTADVQYAQAGRKVNKRDLKPGDLVFFETYEKGASHVGIYMGDGKFIHASSSKGVTVSRLGDDYYKTRYVGARRVLG